MNTPESLIRDLPDPDSARRFLHQLADQHPAQSKKLLVKAALLSDVLTLVSYSPLIASTLLHYPEYIWWLDRRRHESGVRTKDELLESLARFTLTNSQVDQNILLARFRRRELIRIFLADIRRLLTVAEITEGISNLADAILENASRSAAQDLTNRFGSPQVALSTGRQKAASGSVVSLGKLGSRELNYSSDIDLLFIYSEDGMTSSGGSREAITNREYFGKLAAAISKLVGGQSGEGAAYRVDLRLRPHGRVGPLAMSLADTVRYYTAESAPWERQVLIRSRASAGDPQLFHSFFEACEGAVFSTDETVENALRNVRLSKQKIDASNRSTAGLNVKLGRGGIREIEFIAQALQLAYGGRDAWLRSPHTLISLSRIGDRGLLDDRELTELFEAYDFLRRLEHLLQMENGLQTQLVPGSADRRGLLAKRMKCDSLTAFDAALAMHTGAVRRVFERVFAEAGSDNPDPTVELTAAVNPDDLPGGAASLPDAIRASVEKSDTNVTLAPRKLALLQTAADISPRVIAAIAAVPHLVNDIPDSAALVLSRDYVQLLDTAVAAQLDLGARMTELRRVWSRMDLEIVVLDAAGMLSLEDTKRRQTDLAEASIAAAMRIVRGELEERYGQCDLDLAALGLGKLGSGGIDHESDLDLVMVFDETEGGLTGGLTSLEYYARAVEIFVTALSGVTRDGSLYRIDLRLRPHGKNGASVISGPAFVEYVENSAAIWELLAFVKVRAAGGKPELGTRVESAVRDAIHRRAATIDAAELAAETRRIRARLETEKTPRRGRKEIDIKYGAGGMLDIYFAVRFLQLRDDVRDSGDRRSTGAMLDQLAGRGSLDAEAHSVLTAGYRFLSALDHNIRLTAGRTTLLPVANKRAIGTIADRLGYSSPDEILQRLTIHRIELRRIFERITAGG